MKRFYMDAARWVVPGQVADPTTLTVGIILGLLLRHPPLRAMAWYRLACWCKARSIPFIYGTIIRWIFFRFGFEIWGDIDGGLYVPHPVGSVIAVERMGPNCSVIASATIGMQKEHGFPTLGEGVFIGAGARVLGRITIGDFARIGANAVVLTDLPGGSTAVGVPARVVDRAGKHEPSHTLSKNGTLFREIDL